MDNQWWDSDIAVMTLTDEEKNGLQVFRNYSGAFERHRQFQLVAELDELELKTSDLADVLTHIVREEPRSIPVIACAFADDHLKEMYKREIPEGVPGGRSTLFTGFGSLSSLAKRIQMAYAFQWLSQDILIELNHLRGIRNDISHKWDIRLLEQKLQELIASKQHAFEEYLGDGSKLPTNFHEKLDPIGKFRTRVIWVLGRLFYEAALWVPVVKNGLNPAETLYGDGAPKVLGEVAGLCIEATKEVVVANEI